MLGLPVLQRRALQQRRRQGLVYGRRSGGRALDRALDSELALAVARDQCRGVVRLMRRQDGKQRQLQRPRKSLLGPAHRILSAAHETSCLKVAMDDYGISLS